ncbi:MAG: LuxR C-terminal-related transcriptional regulator [Bacteroidales bacterium]
MKFNLLTLLLIIGIGVGNIRGQDGVEREEMIKCLEDAERLPYSTPQKAISYANKVISYAQKCADMEMLARAYLVNGFAYGNYGDFATGFEYVLKAKESCPSESIGLNGKILTKLSNLYIYLRDLNRAFEYANKGLGIAQELKDSVMIATCYNTIGLINIYVPDIELSEQNFNKALEINRAIGNKSGISRNLNNLSLYKDNRTEVKIAQLFEAIEINKEIGQTWSLAENYNNLGMQYYYGGNNSKALGALRVARDYATQINAKELILDNDRYFADVYQACGNYNEAYNHIKVVLSEVEREKMAEQIRIYETNLLQKKLNTTRDQIKIREQEYQLTKMKYSVLIVVLLFIAVFLITVYVAYRYRQRKTIQILTAKNELEQQRKEMMQKEKEFVSLQLAQREAEAHSASLELKYIREELTNTAFFVKTRGEMLTNIQGQIKEAYKLPDTERLAKLYEINSDISQFHAKNNEMELLVDKVSSDFIFKLSQKYPNLTKNEQRLASLLRIGLSSKEIATITSSQPKTVDMARYRLRKKMNLDSEESLHSCLCQL